MSVVIKEIETKGVMTKSNLPVSDYSVNPYVGCVHGCKYCYASFMKRFTNHPEPWGDFVDVKYWTPIKKVRGQGGVHRLRHRPLPALRKRVLPHPRITRTASRQPVRI